MKRDVTAIVGAVVASGFLLHQVVRTASWSALIVAAAALAVVLLQTPTPRESVAAAFAPSMMALALSRGASVSGGIAFRAQDAGQDVVIVLLVGLIALAATRAAAARSKGASGSNGANLNGSHAPTDVADLAATSESGVDATFASMWWKAGGLVVLLFVSALLLRVAIPVAVSGGVLAVRLMRTDGENDEHDARRRTSSWLRIAPLAMALVIGALCFRSAAVKTEAPPEEPKAAVEYWRRRENLFRAHHAALRWSSGEKTPRDGYLALALIDWELGERDKAKKVLSKILARTDDDAIRARAEQLAAAWGAAE